jgi:hypothetical protein
MRDFTWRDLIDLANRPEGDVPWFPHESGFRMDVVEEDTTRFGTPDNPLQAYHLGNGFFVVGRKNGPVWNVKWYKSVAAYKYVYGMWPSPEIDFEFVEFEPPPFEVVRFRTSTTFHEWAHRVSASGQSGYSPKSKTVHWEWGSLYFPGWDVKVSDPPMLGFVYPFGMPPEFFPGLPGFDPAMIKTEEPYVRPVSMPVDEVVDTSDPVLIVGEILGQLNYWKFAGRVKLGKNRKDFERSNRDGSQYWFVDGEDLADGLVPELLEAMRSSLEKCGLRRLDVQTLVEAGHDSDYRLLINGELVVVSELDASGTLITDDPWMDATILPLRIVNRELRAAGSRYQVLVIDPGSPDGIAMLLPVEFCHTLRQHDALRDHLVVVP